MFRPNKRCRKMLEMSTQQAEVDPEADTTLPSVSINSDSKVKIIQNIQICAAPGTSKECNSLNNTPKRPKMIYKDISNTEQELYKSPSTSVTLHVLQNAQLQSTPISKRYSLMNSKESTPTSIRGLENVCSVSRCSSVSDLSCAKFLSCPLSDVQVSDILHDIGNEPNNNTVHQLSSNAPSEKSNNKDELGTNTDNEDHDYVPESLDSDESSSLSTDFSSSDSDLENCCISTTQTPTLNETNTDDEWVDIEDNIPNIAEYAKEATINVPESAKTPLDYYNLFVTEEIIEKIVTETNNYANAYISSNNTTKSRSRHLQWTPATADEMKIFLGVLMAMGLAKVPHINDYWSKKTLYGNKYISTVISRDRFLLLLKFWHFSNIPATDKLSKVKDVYLMLLQRFQTVLRPGKFLIIDESMIPWRGRLKFRQYIKNKSHKYGVKLYKLCTPEGYTFNVIIYTGKGEEGREMDHGRKTVMRLIKDLMNEGRVVITDNFYNSVGLAEELLLNKTMLCGTLRSNRKGVPKSVVSKKIKRGEIFGKMNRKGVRVLKWFDKRPVYMISTCREHDTTIIDTGKKRRGTEEEIRKPKCVLTYNSTKKGIDYSDQMSSYHTPLKRGLKWYRKVMMELLFGTALVNSWIVFNIGKEKRVQKKEFCEAVIEGLTKKAINATISDPSRVVLKKNHTFEKKGDKRRRCTGCYIEKRLTMSSREANKKVKKIFSYCVECKKHLCLKCFYDTHM